MSLDRFTNKEEILNTSGLVHGLTWAIEDSGLLKLDESNVVIDQKGEPPLIEIHAYTPTNDYITGGLTEHYELRNDKLYVNYLNALNEFELTRGLFEVVINVQRTLLGTPNLSETPLYIKEISPDRREASITVNVADSDTKDVVADTVSDYLELFGRNSYTDILYDEEGNEVGTVERPISQNIAINLGNNNVFKIINQKEWGESNEFVVRFYKPLPPTINEKMPLWIVEELADSFIDNIDINVEQPSPKTNLLAGANFAVGDEYSTITETDFRNWNELLDTTTASTQQIIDKIFSGSFGKGPSYDGPNNYSSAPAIDYSGYQNFIHYSSAKERVVNFKYKLQLIEYYNTQLEILDAATGTDATSLQGNIAKNQRHKDRIIGGMDGFERWLYNEQTSSLFSHFDAYDRTGVNIRSNGGFIGEQGYTLQPWPKYIDSNTDVLHHSTSSIAIDWYDGVFSSASLYDTENNNQLLNSIPAHIQEDENNSQYVMFIDMIAHHFDILYSYIKALTKVPVGEEHPKLGVNKQLLYQAAKGMGWTLANGRQASQLWQYTLGKSGSGEYKSTGTLFSKSDEEITTDVWRRIVNNLPYLLKTKGTARSIKALMNTYGIPQTMLSIREYGGPKIDADAPALIEDRFSYALRFNQGASIQFANVLHTASTAPHLEKVFTDVGANAASEIAVRTHQFRFKPYTGSNMMLASALNWAGTSVMQFALQHTSSYSGSSMYGRVHFAIGQSGSSGKGATASCTPWVPIYDGNFWNFQVSKANAVQDSDDTYTLKVQQASDYITGKIVHSASVAIQPANSPIGNQYWAAHTQDLSYGGLGGFRLGGHSGSNDTSLVNAVMTASFGISGSEEVVTNDQHAAVNTGTPPITAMPFGFSGSMQEYRGWLEEIDQETFNFHTLNPSSYVGTLSPTSSYGTLIRHYPLGTDLKAIDRSSGIGTIVSSSHPANHIKDFQKPINQAHVSSSTYATASGFSTPTNAQRGNYIPVEETYYVQGISLGGNNPRSQKIRLENNYLIRPLGHNATGERSSFDYAPIDSNRLGLFYSMADQINKDIFNHVGDVELDDFVGDPTFEFKTAYTDLHRFADNYWKKFSNKNDINAYLRVFSLYDFTLFNQIKQLLPARTKVASGLLIEPHALERAKVKIYEKPVKSEPMYTASIQYMDIFENTNPRGDTLLSGSIIPISASIDDIAPTADMRVVTHATKSGYFAPEYTMAIPMTSSRDDDQNELSSILVRDNNVYNGTVYKHISTLFPYKVAPAAAAALSLPYAITMSQHPLNYGFSGSVIYNQRPSIDGDRYPIKHYHRTRADFDKATNTLFRAVSESLNMPYSESLIVAPNRTEYANTFNQRIGGCRLTAGGINQESNIPALSFKPIIEVFEVNANQLVYTSNVQLGNLDVR